MPLTIGDLGRRLRVSVRTLHHYDAIGLLVPAAIDARNGYRQYTDVQLVRGLRIEQLKATGMRLADIASALGDDEPNGDGGHPDAIAGALIARRAQILAERAAQRNHLDTIEALLAGRNCVSGPEVVETAGDLVVVDVIRCSADRVAPTIRTAMQRIGRSTRTTAHVCCTSFSARFDLDVADDTDIQISVAGHVDEPAPTSVRLRTERRLQLEVTGPIAVLPLAYDVLLGVAAERHLRLAGTVVEHYLDLAAVGRTIVALPLLD